MFWKHLLLSLAVCIYLAAPLWLIYIITVVAGLFGGLPLMAIIWLALVIWLLIPAIVPFCIILMGQRQKRSPAEA